MRRAVKFFGLTLALFILVSTGACAGASVSVYGTGYYGPGAWGGYPYPGRYPPMGGGVFVGVCCDEEEQQQEEQEELEDRDGGDADGGLEEGGPRVEESPGR